MKKRLGELAILLVLLAPVWVGAVLIDADLSPWIKLPTFVATLLIVAAFAERYH